MNIDDYRKKIDEIDAVILEKLEERFDLAVKIGECKKESGAPILDSDREWQKLEALENMSNPDFAEYNLDVFEAIMAASRAIQESE